MAKEEGKGAQNWEFQFAAGETRKTVLKVEEYIEKITVSSVFYGDFMLNKVMK